MKKTKNKNKYIHKTSTKCQKLAANSNPNILSLWYLSLNSIIKTTVRQSKPTAACNKWKKAIKKINEDVTLLVGPVK